MSSELQQLFADRKLFRARISSGMILKEIEAAQGDLHDAQDSLERKKFKWATIQGYYSMFHSARALLYHHGFRERSHHALLVSVRELSGNELGKSLISRFAEGMELRQEADYGLKFSEAGATETVEGAEEFLKRAQELLKIR
jgi:uncharacterized protein (UPF0332 family)